MASELTVVRVRSLIEGSPLAEAMTDTDPADTEDLKVERITDFDEEGGTAIAEPQTDTEEVISYEGIDEDTDELLGITRAATAFDHPIGTFVQAGAKATRFKVADGYLDDEEDLIEGVRIPRFLWKALPVGVYDNEDMVVVPVGEDDDGHLVVLDAPEESDDLYVAQFFATGELSDGQGGKGRHRFRFDAEIVEVGVIVDTPSSTGDVIADLHVCKAGATGAGTTVFNDQDLRPTAPEDETSGRSTPDRPRVKKGDHAKAFIDEAGTGAADATVELWYRKI